MTWVTIILELLSSLLKAFTGAQSASHDNQERQAGSDASQVKAQNEENARVIRAADAANTVGGLPADGKPDPNDLDASK